MSDNKKQKSPDEIEKERQEALDQINTMLNNTAPKGIGQGVTTGVSNIVQGAIGAVGVAVLLPTLGLGVGLKQGGILGGIVGVTGGAVVGALGAVALAVGGAVSGVSQIVRGVVAVPQQIIAPRQGKWWNENEGRWVLTNMDEQAEALETVPDDDSDILGAIKEELDERASTKTLQTGTVTDMYYYEVLEVPCDADAHTIKRRYYVLARQYHPDRVGADDVEAAEKFKAIAEAYQVLSDPELRAKYDQDGREGLSADKTETAGPGQIDADLLFAFLFGSDLFYDYIGRFATATSASIGDSPKVSVKDARKLQQRRVARLALKLIVKISPWVAQVHAGSDGSAVSDAWKEEAVELSKASYGYELVTTIGKVYNLLAIMAEGTNEGGNGMPGVSKWAAAQKADLDARRFEKKTKMAGLRAGLDMMKLQSELQQKMKDAKTDEEKAKIEQELQDASIGIVMRVLWTTAVVDITSTLYETCQMVFFDHAVDQETRQARIKAVKALGQAFMDVAEAEESAEKKDAKTLYEEAAFAAMLETVKRKDEATYGHASKRSSE